MGKLVVTEFLALDGVFEEPGEWPKGYWNDEIEKFKFDELKASDALLLGRVTYDGFAAAWPTMPDAGEFGEKINSMPKYVVSTTLRDPKWHHTHVINDNVAHEVKKLKHEFNQDIVVHGSGNLLKTLMEHDLVDEYRFLLYPFALGKGKHLFQGDQLKLFKLKELKQFSTGVVLLMYEPKRN